MQTLSNLFGQSPFEHIVVHARKIHECVNLLRPIAEAILAGNMGLLAELQDRMSRTEYEADRIKDEIRQSMPRQLFLPVARDDVLTFVRQLDCMGDDAENFSVVATFRRLNIPEDVRPDFSALVEKTIQTSEGILAMAEELAQLQKEDFEGSKADRVVEKIKEVCKLEWESDKQSRVFARHYFSLPTADPMDAIILDKLCRHLTGIADHAENVGKSLRLMILRH